MALPRNSDWAGPRRATVTPSTDKTNLTVLKPRARPNTPSKIRPTTGAPPSTPSMCVPSYPEVAPPPSISVNPVLQQRQVTPVIDHSITPPIQPVRQEPRPDLPAPTTRNEHQQQHTYMPSLHVSSKPPQRKQNNPQQHQASSQPKSATQPDIAGNSFISTLSTVSLELSKGIEHPEIYLDILNILLTHHGYANITIPKHAIDMSKNIFNHHHPGVTKTTIPFSVLHRAPPSSPVFPITVHTTK